MQLTQVYSQKSTRTTLPRSPFVVSGGEFSHFVAPSSSGAAGASGWQARVGRAKQRASRADAHRIASPAGRARARNVRKSLIEWERTRRVRETRTRTRAKYSTLTEPPARRSPWELALIRALAGTERMLGRGWASEF